MQILQQVWAISMPNEPVAHGSSISWILAFYFRVSDLKAEMSNWYTKTNDN